MKKAVVLLSGGLDSTTCLALAHHEQYDIHALSFDYGQKHSAELIAAKKIALKFGVSQHIIQPLQSIAFTDSALTDSHQAISDHQASDTIPNTYVPARNTIFLSIALGVAEVIQAEAIFIGVSAVDYSGYPDCRPAFIQAFQQLIKVATKATAASEQTIALRAPLLQLSKAQTIQLGHTLGVDYAMTQSCYRLNAKGHACGRCSSCQLRQQGFHDAGIKDPTTYINSEH